MHAAVAKGSNTTSRNVRQNDFFQQLQQLFQDTNTLWSRIVAEVNRAAHSEDADLVILVKECDTCLREFKKLSDLTIALKAPVEQKISVLKLKSLSGVSSPIEAHSIQTIMTLHLVGNQNMAKRLEELQDIEHKRKDTLNKLESWLKMSSERFNDIVLRLNLLCYMRDCLKNDGFLPCNVMYSTNIPQIVCSPFAERLTKVLQPNGMVPQPPQFTKEQQQRDLEKRRNYLMQMRAEMEKQEKQTVKK